MSIARTAATGGALDPDFLRWQTSLPVDRRLLEVDVQGSIAHVTGLVHAGILTEEEGKTLQRALAQIPRKVADGEMVLPLEEDVHMAVEVLLRGEVGELADKLHTGRSRNDQVATDFKLWARKAVAQLHAAIDAVVAGVKAWSTRQGDVPMPAYTHRQVAIPVLSRMWIDAALSRPLGRDQRLLWPVRDELGESPLGAGAIAGTSLPIDAKITANALGFDEPPQNPLDAIGQRDHAVSLAFVCARVSMHVGRFSADVVELASDGLVKLGGSIACGSSMMPHKRNPDLFELARAQSALRQGDLVAIMGMHHGLGSGYHRDFQHDKEVLFRTVDGTIATLGMIVLALDHLELVPERCLQVLKDGDAVATDLTEALVESGVAFRDAYRQVGALVAEQREKGKRLADLTVHDLAAHDLPESLLERLDPAQAAVRRTRKFDPPEESG